MPEKIFITGVSGCVGHYVFDCLVKNPDYHLYLLLRQPERVKRNLSMATNVSVLPGEMKDIAQHANLLKQMDFVVHLAAGWGETEANYDYTLELFKLLDPVKCQKVIYFSTASILDQNNQLVPGLDKIGTSYIKGKYLCHQALPQLEVYDRIITLYPTWVLGGDDRHPYSHATAGMLAARKWLGLIRFFSADISFHFIHAQDIAAIVAQLLKGKARQKHYVLGNPVITAQEFIKQFCQSFGQKVYFQINLPLALIAALPGKRLSEWDRFCLLKRHFQHQVVNARTFGLESKYETIGGILS